MYPEEIYTMCEVAPAELFYTLTKNNFKNAKIFFGEDRYVRYNEDEKDWGDNFTQKDMEQDLENYWISYMLFWKYQLREMVLMDNPLLFMEEFLTKNKSITER